MITLIMWCLTSIIGGSFNPMEWNWVWRVIAVIWFLFVGRKNEIVKQSGGGIGIRYMFWKEIGIIPTLTQIKDFTGSIPVLTTSITTN